MAESECLWELLQSRKPLVAQSGTDPTQAGPVVPGNQGRFNPNVPIARMSSMPDLTGLPPELIMKMGDASAANYRSFADAMRGSYGDQLNAAKFGLSEDQFAELQMNNAATRQYNQQRLILESNKQTLDAIKAQLDYAIKSAKNEADIRRIEAMELNYRTLARKVGLQAQELNNKLSAIQAMRGFEPGEEIPPHLMAGAGWKPNVPSTKDKLDADWAVRSRMYELDSEGNPTGKIRQDMSANDEASLSKALDVNGQQLNVIELPDTTRDRSFWFDADEKGRKLYVITP